MKNTKQFFRGMIALLLAFVLTLSFPNGSALFISNEPTSVSAATTDYGLADNVQDGVILHAWNWSYNTIKDNLADIAAAGYTTVQTSPVQQPKDYSSSYTDVAGQWWKLYQPVSFSIASKSWLGTKSELKALCTAADAYGIKIICDIVVNHLGNGSGNGGLSPQVATYEPTFYNNTGSYLWNSSVAEGDYSVEAVVRASYGGRPDINTSSTYVQQRVISLLKECIDCGVDGFRWDMAKHIETSYDGSYASNFWKNVINTATSYASTTKGITLYNYGEILNTPGTGRSFSYYTDLMSITDNQTGNKIRQYVAGGDASSAKSNYYYTGQSANKLVLWAESHDTYEDASSSSVSTANINKTWAIVASRANAASLYFVRPGSATMGNVGTTQWKTASVAAVNKFHNAYIGAKEYLSSSGNVVMNERYFEANSAANGCVLVNCSGTTKTVSSMAVNKMADGTYTDEITGNKFTVSGGKISGKIGSTGIAVLIGTSGSASGSTSSKITVYFSNNYSWSSVYCYYWGSDSSSVTWPGTAMTYVGKNEYNESIYKMTIPADVSGIIFNDGSSSQTVDITSGIADGLGYYITGTSSGKYTVGTYTYSS